MGCPKCKQLDENVRKAVDELGIDAEVVKVENPDKITGYGVMVTPALVIEGEGKVAGRVSSSEEIKQWLS